MIVIEFTSNELRAARFKRLGDPSSVESSFVLPLTGELTPASAETFGTELKNALAKHRIPPGDAVALLGRGWTSLKALRIPSAPDNELPALVGFAAADAMPQASESEVDFQAGAVIPSNSPEEGDQQEVLVAVASKSTIEAIRRGMTKAGLTLKRLGLRPFGSLAVDILDPQPPTVCRAIVYVSMHTLEVSIWKGESLRLCRFIPVTPSSTLERISAEVSRTVAAFHSESSSAMIDRFDVVSADADPLASMLRSRLSGDIHANSLPPDAVDFVSMAGASKIAPNKSWAIDLLKPKQAVREIGQNKRIGILASALGVVLLGGGYYYLQNEITSRDTQITRLTNEIAQITSELSQLKPTTDRHRSIKPWIDAGDPVLDEMQEIAAALPGTDDLFLTGFEFTAGQADQLASIKIDGVARDQSTITRIQTRLASDGSRRYELIPSALDPGGDYGSFVWRFGLDLRLAPTTDDAYAKRVEERNKRLDEATKLADKMERRPLTLARNATARTPTNVADRRGRREEKQEAKADEKQSKGSELLERKVAELRKMSPEEREEALSKEKVFLQKRLRRALEEGSP